MNTWEAAVDRLAATLAGAAADPAVMTVVAEAMDTPKKKRVPRRRLRGTPTADNPTMGAHRPTKPKGQGHAT